ncbi:MAG: hypothetical protein HYV07_20665 [Deltaproteobacteria bacterium]|nr:hypothetical protein [Deltaproteobacteria bacterium]
MRLLVVLNPSSRDFEASRRYPAIERKLARAEVDLVETSPDAGETRTRVEAGLAKNPERVVAIGGDGTVHSVVNIMFEGRSERPLPQLAVVPFGTANDVAKSLRLPLDDLDALAGLACGAFTRPFDVGLVRAKGDQGLRSAYFLDSVSIGMDADVLATRDRHRGLGGYLAYAAAMAERALVATKFDARIVVDGEKLDDRVFNIIVNNSPVYAGELTMPRSSASDGLLDVYVFDRAEYASKLLTFAVKQADLLKLGVDAFLEDITENQREVHGRDVSIRLASPRRLQVDGELFGSADEVFCSVAGAVEVASPR